MTSGAGNTSAGLQIDLLGPVEARVDGRSVPLGGQLPRGLFAVLALKGGHVVANDRLIDELWGEDPPARARDSLQMHISRLRRALTEAGVDGGRLVSHSGGYVLVVRPGERDIDRWHEALDRAHRAHTAGQLQAARDALEEAARVWRGPPLEGVSAHGVLAAERARLGEEHLGALIDAIELDLELGHHGEVLGQLEALVIAHPFKERLVELQMLALYRSGRQADALAAFQGARRRLVDELGIEPSQPLRELHESVLKHSAELSAPASSVEGALEAQPRPSATSAISRLPVPPNRTIGRERDVSAVGARLRVESVRLLTLVGPGGVGKTRLAVEAVLAVEADFADGAHFVSLAPVQRARDVPAALVASLGIVPLSGESADQAVERFLAAKRLLLTVDNCEHLPAAAPFIGRLPTACPGVTVLATSREALTVRAEQRYLVSPLSVPAPETAEDPQELAGVDAVALFCERARAHDPGFASSDDNILAIAEICRRVDGLPLAIELAAARCGLLSPGEIAERLQDALGGLGAGVRDAPARQQTLRATIDWSHDLLNEEEQTCFARFAVFVGGATVDAAEAITGADLDTLDRLVAKSMIVRRRAQPSGQTRLTMLETVRAYAGERFAAVADADAVRQRHFRFFLALAERHGSDRALWGKRRKEHLAQLDADIENIHAALAWAVGRGDPEPALALCSALGRYWLMRDRYADAVDWIDRALALPGADAHVRLRVRGLHIKSWAVWPLGRRVEQQGIIEEAEAIARALADPRLLAEVLGTRASHESTAGRLDVADAIADEAIRWARTIDDDWAIAMASYVKAMAAQTARDLREHVDRAAWLLQEVGNVYQLADLLASAAYGALCLGSDQFASELVARAVPLTRELDSPYLWMLLCGNVGLAALMMGDADAAGAAFREELLLCRKLVIRPFASEGLAGLAAVATVADDLDRAARLYGAAGAHRYDDPQDPVDSRLDTTFFDPARVRLGVDRWAAAARAGASLGFEDAIAYALDEPRALEF